MPFTIKTKRAFIRVSPTLLGAGTKQQTMKITIDTVFKTIEVGDENLKEVVDFMCALFPATWQEYKLCTTSAPCPYYFPYQPSIQYPFITNTN